MKRCPITYESCEEGKYSKKALRLLSGSLKNLNNFPYTTEEQIELATEFATKLSIQGYQPKLSVLLNVKEGVFKVVEKGGRFIIKPPNPLYKELPQNEDLTMRLAAEAEIIVPFHGMVYNSDDSLSYFIKRFDRKRSGKIAVEDFSQLLGYDRDTKYESSMEKIVSVLEKHCTFPATEKVRLFRLVIFNFLVGNEDMHLKNYSLIRDEHKVELSPAYDLLNSTIIMKAPEEIALPIGGRKKNLKKEDLFDYFGRERMGLQEAVLLDEFNRFKNILPKWKELLAISFLSPEMRHRYEKVIDERWDRLNAGG